MNWTRTNCAECHFRIAGRIFGKVALRYSDSLWFASVREINGRLVSWGRKTPIGERKTMEAAQGLVERRIAKWIEKWPGAVA
jgi:hypothetical protein